MGLHIPYREPAPVGARGLALPRGGRCGRAAAKACIKTAGIKAESMMELRWLQDFLMVAETGNLRPVSVASCTTCSLAASASGESLRRVPPLLPPSIWLRR